MTLALAAMVSTASLAAGAPSLNQWQTLDRKAAPSGSFRMEKGEAHRLSDFQGQVVVLNLWATWCTPCLKELPALDKLEETYAPRGLVVLPLSVDTVPFSQLQQFIAAQKLELPHLAQDSASEIHRSLAPGGLPATYLIDRKGVIRYAYLGAADWMDQAQTTHIETLLKE